MEKSYFDRKTNRENTSSVKFDLRKKIFGRDDIIPLWVADMDFESPDFIKNAFLKKVEHNIYGYTFRDENFSKSVKQWMRNRHDWEIEEEWVTFSPGIVPALNFCVNAYTKPGDKIIVQPPVYFPFFSAIRDNHRILLENQLLVENGKYKMDFENLIKIIDKDVKMILLCSPHNPVGRVWTRQELIQLSEICVKNDILIVSDEIHHDLIYKGHQHIPTAKLSEPVSENTITCIAPSKTFNVAGLSSSAIIISNEDLRNKFVRQIEKYHIGQGNIFGNIAMQAAYTYGEKYVDTLMPYLEENKDYVKDYLYAELPGIKMINAEATYLLWLDFSELGIPQKKLNEKLINNAKIGLSDGRLFGRGGNGFQRMNIATGRDIIYETMNRMKSVFA